MLSGSKGCSQIGGSDQTSRLKTGMIQECLSAFLINLTVHFNTTIETGCIGVAPITQLRTCVIKVVTFKGGHLMW